MFKTTNRSILKLSKNNIRRRDQFEATSKYCYSQFLYILPCLNLDLGINQRNSLRQGVAVTLID